MRFLRQSLAGIFLASLALALVIYAGQTIVGAVQTRMSTDKRAPQASERVFAVNLQRAALETVVPVLEAFGQIQSTRTLELRTPVGGRVVSLSDHFVEGGTVRAGDVLVQIDPADTQAVLDRVQSDLLDAEAEERDAARGLILARDEQAAAEEQADLRDRAYRRQQDLESRGVATAATVETAELAAASARQAVVSRRQAVAVAEARIDQAATKRARATIALGEAQRTLAETTLKAQFDGTLSEVTLVEGRLVSQNEKLAMLIDADALEVAFRVSTAQYSRLLDDQGRLIEAPVRLTLDGGGAGLHASGHISRDSAGVAAGQSGRMIYARLDRAPGFKPGDFVTAEVDEPALEQVARLPASVIDAAGTVLVMGPDQRLESIPVELVRRQGNEVILRGSALSGRQVVVGRTPLLGAGIRVRPLRPEAEPLAAGPSDDPDMLHLTSERRARLVAFVEGNNRMPTEMKTRVLTQLTEEAVPAALVARIEARMGG